ncbi:MAG: NnrS family protein [Magnetospirillum sp.]|nr:NnrS family protein [Magnetospirillum sp.]
MSTIRLQEPAWRPYRGPVFFAAGFRPFFLFAAVEAAAMLPLWLAAYAGAVDLGVSYPPSVWHGHEMVFGFAAAALGGFLLTAVPNWTNCRPVRGVPLMVLSALWLAGRAAFVLGSMLPPLAVAAADLAYVPVLAVLVAGPLIAAGKWRNIAFVPILGLFWLCDLAVHLGMAGIGDPMRGVYGGIAVLLLMITIVGGRIVPSFTRTWLAMRGRPVEPRPLPWVEKGAVLGVAAGGALAALAPGSAAAGWVLIAAAAIHGFRLSRWHGLGTVGEPLLWVLHVGYAWLVAGLFLLGLSSFVPALPASAAVHALTAGCVGTMIMAVMSRAALGHSGRPLRPARPVVAAYGLLSAGAALRVAAPLAGGAQTGLTHAGGALWALAWLLFVMVYLPIVTAPRADGQPG